MLLLKYAPLFIIASILGTVIYTAVFKLKYFTVPFWQRIGAGVLVSFIIGIMVTMGGWFSSRTSVVLNGEVISKSREKVSCEHQYVCGEICTTGSDGKRSCRPKYCDEHAYDVDWVVKTSVGSLTIDRVDRRGVKEPQRFTDVIVGEPASQIGSHRDYLLIDKNRYNAPSLLERYHDVLPKYPTVYDYYRFDRVVYTDSNDQGKFDWIDAFLDDQLKADGKEHELNVIVVVTRSDEEFADALRNHWHGARPNDLWFVYGLKDEQTIAWFRAISYADSQGNTGLVERLRISTIGKELTPELVIEQYGIITTMFERLSTKTFEYLANSYEPSEWVVMALMLVNLIIGFFISFVFYKNENL